MTNEIENDMPMAPKAPVARPMKPAGAPPAIPAWANPDAVVAAPVPPPWATAEAVAPQATAPVFAAPVEQPQFTQAPTPQIPQPVIPVEEKIEKPVEQSIGAIEIEDGIPLPEIKRKSAKVSPYPFDLLNVGQSFFVPMEVKKMATHANQAMKKKMIQDGTFTKNKKGEDVPTMVKSVVFEIRAAEKNGVAGCRVFRTA